MFQRFFSRVVRRKLHADSDFDNPAGRNEKYDPNKLYFGIPSPNEGKEKNKDERGQTSTERQTEKDNKDRETKKEKQRRINRERQRGKSKQRKINRERRNRDTQTNNDKDRMTGKESHTE